MPKPSALQVCLIVEIGTSKTKDASWTTNVASFAQALTCWLDSEGFDRLHQPQVDQNIFVTRIDPPTRIGEALDAVRSLLKVYKIKNVADVSFEKISCDAPVIFQ